MRREAASLGLALVLDERDSVSAALRFGLVRSQEVLVAKDDDVKGKIPSFQEVARKFKPGPVAPPEHEEDRPDMSGAALGEPGAARPKQVPEDQPHGVMCDGW